MPNSQTLVDAIVGFTDWNHPWQFKSHVEQALCASFSDQLLFEEIWAEATSAHHWDVADLDICVAQAGSALLLRYTALSQEAIAAICNAAAYHWR
jgi:hypothetical protein